MDYGTYYIASIVNIKELRRVLENKSLMDLLHISTYKNMKIWILIPSKGKGNSYQHYMVFNNDFMAVRGR